METNCGSSPDSVSKPELSIFEKALAAVHPISKWNVEAQMAIADVLINFENKDQDELGNAIRKIMATLKTHPDLGEKPLGDQAFTKRQVEMAYCIGVLGMKDFTIEKVTERNVTEEWKNVYFIITDAANN